MQRDVLMEREWPQRCGRPVRLHKATVFSPVVGAATPRSAAPPVSLAPVPFLSQDVLLKPLKKPFKPCEGGNSHGLALSLGSGLGMTRGMCRTPGEGGTPAKIGAENL